MTQKSFADVLGLPDVNKRPRYKGALVEINSINVLRQPRVTFEDIDLLATDIKRHGLLHPLTVAQLDESGAAGYLSVLNKLWGTTYRLANLKRRRGYYFILLAGERRFRALRRIGTKRGRANVCVNVKPIEALFLQMSENTHRPVPPHEEAQAYYQLFKLIREADPEFSMAAFARNVGRAPSTIRNALRFAELPLRVRKYVEDGFVPYGMAVELSRLQEGGAAEDEILRWAIDALVSRKKVPELREQVTKHLFDRKNGQASLFELTPEETKNFRRRVVEQNIIQELWSHTAYFQKVLRMFREGLLGLDDSPFSAGSPMRKLQAEVGVMKELLPHIRTLKILSARKIDGIEAVLVEAEEVISSSV